MITLENASFSDLKGGSILVTFYTCIYLVVQSLISDKGILKPVLVSSHPQHLLNWLSTTWLKYVTLEGNGVSQSVDKK